MITEGEYGAQPGYMTKNITLDQLNNHVREMQALLDRNARGLLFCLRMRY